MLSRTLLLIAFLIVFISCGKRNFLTIPEQKKDSVKNEIKKDSLTRQDTSSKKEYKRKPIPEKYSSAVELLDYIKEQHIKKIEDTDFEVPVFISYISTRGLTIWNINKNESKSYTIEDIKKQMSEKKGEVYLKIWHIAAVYLQPQLNYSKLTFKESNEMLKIHIEYGYDLTYLLEDGKYKLLKIDYIVIEKQ